MSVFWDNKKMHFKHLLAPIICLISLVVVNPAYSGIVGPASDYNVFVFGNFTSSNADTEGSLAAGGNVNVINYSVASQVTGGNGARLVAGGNVTASNGGASRII